VDSTPLEINKLARRYLRPVLTSLTNPKPRIWRLRGMEYADRPDLRQSNRCESAELVCDYALGLVPASEVTAIEIHIAICSDCQREIEGLRSVVHQFVAWPTDVLRPATSLHRRLALRIAEESGMPSVLPTVRPWSEAQWEQVAPGIECKLLATDPERHRISMQVRLAPGARYPGHTHASDEELHLLDGELWIDERKLCPGDYYRAAPGSNDDRVWSATGCTCVLMTSTRDVLR